MSFVANAQMREHDLTKTRQQNKFKQLIDSRDKKKESENKVNNSLANECMSKWVKNYSDCVLSDPELSVLKKGLNFALSRSLNLHADNSIIAILIVLGPRV